MAVSGLHHQVETLAALSLLHLRPHTRAALMHNSLSVNAYPTPQGGFVYVGAPRYDTPLESDLASLFALAEQAGAVWLKFDAGAAIIDALPVYLGEVSSS